MFFVFGSPQWVVCFWKGTPRTKPLRNARGSYRSNPSGRKIPVSAPFQRTFLNVLRTHKNNNKKTNLYMHVRRNASAIIYMVRIILTEYLIN